MNTTSVSHPARQSMLVPAAIVCGCATLLLRPSLMAEHGGTTFVVVLFGTLLVIGIAAPNLPATDGPALTMSTALAAAIGCSAFVVGRLLVDGDAVAAALPRIVALNTLAAVAEEAFFRRLVYGWLARWSARTALFGSAVLFAVVHVTVYGWWVVPIDLAAGLVFSWQRWATGTWHASAITHVAANALAVL